MTEKPLHVQVAEALGWTECQPSSGVDLIDCVGTSPAIGPGVDVPRYDTDWSATGPLIEKYGIETKPNGAFWQAWVDEPAMGGAEVGPTPLLAVCNLILALKAAGKL